VQRVAPYASPLERQTHEESPAAAEFARWLLVEAGIDPQIYRSTALRRRIPACLRALHATSVNEARDVILKRRDRLNVALNALLVGVTDFFRDGKAFDDLRDVVVPELSKRCGPLRVWSIGCASGAELYSVSILLSEAGLLDRSLLLGTDCRDDGIAAAKAGFYRDSNIRAVPASIRTKYFEPFDGGWRILKSLRAGVRWKIADISTRSEAGPWDLILWRNTAIYLNPDAGRQILVRLGALLRSGGFLMLGKVERAPADAGVVPAIGCIYRKV
jgi:chemotaxis methyl-accepting protein methylase